MLARQRGLHERPAAGFRIASLPRIAQRCEVWRGGYPDAALLPNAAACIPKRGSARMHIRSDPVAKRAARPGDTSAGPNCEMHAQRARRKDIPRPVRGGYLALSCVVGLSLLTLAPGKYGFAQSPPPSATTDPSHPDLLQEPLFLN